MQKMPLPDRLDRDLIQRLKLRAKAENISVNDVVSKAMDALERETKFGDSLPQRVTFLEHNLSSLLDLVLTFNEKLEEKFVQAGLTEKDRLRCLYKLLKIEIEEHDEAEAARLQDLLQALGAAGVTQLGGGKIG